MDYTTRTLNGLSQDAQQLILRWFIERFAYLAAKPTWSMDDNLDTTEDLHRLGIEAFDSLSEDDLAEIRAAYGIDADEEGE